MKMGERCIGSVVLSFPATKPFAEKRYDVVAHVIRLSTGLDYFPVRQCEKPIWARDQAQPGLSLTEERGHDAFMNPDYLARLSYLPFSKSSTARSTSEPCNDAGIRR